ncbi:MAG: methyltransferase domain-containing protein [Caldisericia bacterium]|jgi:D-alanine-D-alanine ligase|nr:methyltransferase domain-containing protein [Caldisericia bacterium]
MNEKDKPRSSKNGKVTKKELFGKIESLDEYIKSHTSKVKMSPFLLSSDIEEKEIRDLIKKEIDYLIEILKPKENDRILDLISSHGEYSLELARRGFINVEGLDRSSNLIQKSKLRAKKENLPVKFREGTPRKLFYPPNSFDVVLLIGNVFGFFETPLDAFNVLKEIFRVLKKGGKIFIDIIDSEYEKKNIVPYYWQWLDKNHYVLRENKLSLNEDSLIIREIVSHIQKGVIKDSFFSLRLYTKDEILNLLKRAGFSDIQIFDHSIDINIPISNFQIGEKHISFVATVYKEIKEEVKVKKVLRNVCVILGDPKKSDPLKPNHIFDEDDLRAIEKLKETLKTFKNYKFIYLDNHDHLAEELMGLKGKVDYVLNLCDEGYFNDPTKEMHIPAILDVLNIPYTGATPQSLAHAYDKSLVRGIAREMGIPVPDAFLVKPGENVYELPINFPIIVKPNFGDSSFGITQKNVCFDYESLIKVIRDLRDLFGYEKPILIEEFLTGKELSLGIIGNPPRYPFKLLPLAELDYSSLPEDLPKICGYEAKWLPNSPYGKIKFIKATVSEEVERDLIDWSIRLFERLECRDYARFDFRLNSSGFPKLLEVNPNPGWHYDGFLAEIARIQNIDYKTLLELILKSTEIRLGLIPAEEF